MAGVTPLIFQHIPKTAGITIQDILINEYKGLKFFTSWNYKQIELFEKLSDAEKLKIKIIKGHFPFGVHKIYPGPATYFTFLRDPISRSISEFNYIYQDKRHSFHKTMMHEQYTLKDMLKGGYFKNFDNCHVRFLAGANELEYGLVNEETYALALKNFDEYFEAFGITERFDESLIYLKHQLNWSNPFYVNANVSSEKKKDEETDKHLIRYKNGHALSVDAETNELLLHYNKFDILLYNYAYTKFDRIIKSKGEAFAKEVNRFKKINSLHSPLRKAARKVWKLIYRADRN